MKGYMPSGMYPLAADLKTNFCIFHFIPSCWKCRG